MFNRGGLIRDQLLHNVRTLVRIRILFGGMMLTVPVVVVLWQQAGMTLFEVNLVQAIFCLAMAMFEVPSGYLADHFGRKAALLLGMAMLLVAVIGYVLADGFWGFVGAELIMGIGFAFLSGADQALLYDSLRALRCGAAFPRVWGRANAGMLLVGAISSIVGGLLVSEWVLIAWALEGICLILAAGWILSLREVPYAVQERHPSFQALLRIGWNSLVMNPRVRWLIIFPAIVMASTRVAVWLYEPYVRLSGLEPLVLGFLFAATEVVAGIAHWFGAALERRFSERSIVIVVLLGVVASHAAVAMGTGFMGLLFLLPQHLARGFLSLPLGHALNRATSSHERATVISLQSMVGTVLYACLLLPVGLLADQAGPWGAFSALSLALAVFGGLGVTLWYVACDAGARPLAPGRVGENGRPVPISAA